MNIPRYVSCLLAVVACGSPPVVVDAGLDVMDEQNCALSGADPSQPAVEVCNDADDDCDGRVDEGFELLSDLDHCGACDAVCDLEPGTTGASVCVEGACFVEVCRDGMHNCDRDQANGCESDLADVANCGECGAPCELNKAIASCGTGICTLISCAAGFDNCDGRRENGCEIEADSDAFHCGSCGNECPRGPEHASSVCSGGECGIECDPGFADCDLNSIDGCEQPLSSPLSCGACGVVCRPEELCTGDVLRGWECQPPPCVDPPTRCGRSCVDTLIDVNHCGGCGAPCPAAPNARPTCAEGRCGFECDIGFHDCDVNPANGCESRLADERNCGGCDNRCESPSSLGMDMSCDSGTCLPSGCAAWRADCNGDPADGCEIDFEEDLSNCGRCGYVCPAEFDKCDDGVCEVEH